MRLFRALDGALRKRVVWIAAPAGAGKSCLATSYVGARRLKTLWYNVDGRDADVANLFHYLATAARLASPRKKWVLPAFSAENELGPGAFARGFFEALCRQLSVPTVIVFDDYQEAKSELWDEVIREAVGALPKGISILIVSRVDPPPAFARAIASGHIALLGADDLRLTSQEIAGVVRLHRPDLRRAELAAVLPRIFELADGWAAVLSLLLQNRRLGSIDAGHLAESSEHLFDYFAAEILDRATPLQRVFLLKTSVVPSVTAEVAAELTGDRDAARVLADLERRSFLTQRLGTSGAFRYHPLLRDFLRRRAQTDLGSDALRDLHRRAAELLARAGQIDEAMEQYHTAQAVEEAVALLLRVAPSYVAAGKGHTVEMWMASLPAGFVEGSGWLSYWDAMSRLGRSPGRARERFEGAYAHFTREGDAAGLYAACAGAMQAIAHEGMNVVQLDPWIERLQSLQASGPPCPEALKPAAAIGLLIASSFRVTDAAQNRRWAEDAMQIALASDDAGFRVMAGGFLAFFYISEDPARARAIVDMLREAARADESPALSTLTLLLSETLGAWTEGHHDACIRLVREALTIADRSGVFVWNDYLYGLGAAAALGSEDLDGAHEFLGPLGRTTGGRMFATGSYHFYSSWDAVLRGDIPRALQCAELARNCTDALGYPFACAVARLGLAQILALSGRQDDSIVALEEARRIASQLEDAIILHGCDLVEAEFFWDCDRPRALAALRRGLALARQRGYCNTYWSRASMMARLAMCALENDIEPEHVRTIIKRRRLMPATIPVHIEGWPWRYRLRALGSFQIVIDDAETTGVDRGRSAELRGMPLRLLQAVLAFGARGVRDSQLIDALWPDAEGDAGRRVFDTTLHRLRRQVGHDLVRLSEGRVYLDERLCWVDLWALESMLADTDGQIGRGASAAALADLARRLLAVYRGPLLAEDCGDEAWVRGPRERISAKFRRIADRLGHALESADRSADAAALRQRTSRAAQLKDHSPSRAVRRLVS